MRRSWINDLRKRLAELLTASMPYYVAGFEDRTDVEYKRLTGVEQEVVPMLIPHERNHRELLHVIRGIIAALNQGLDGSRPTRSSRPVTTLSRAARKNISTGGVFVATENVRPVGDRLALTFTLPGATQPVSVQSEVRWTREEASSEPADPPAGMGLRFVGISWWAAVAIETFLKEQEPPGSRKGRIKHRRRSRSRQPKQRRQFGRGEGIGADQPICSAISRS